VGKLHFTLTPAAEAKFVAFGILSALCLFYLSTGRQRSDPNRLFLAVVCGLGAMLIFIL